VICQPTKEVKVKEHTTLTKSHKKKKSVTDVDKISQRNYQAKS
jgi:hypothetical protein